MWVLVCYSHVENTSMTASFHEEWRFDPIKLIKSPPLFTEIPVPVPVGQGNGLSEWSSLNTKWAFLPLSWRENVTFNERMLMSAVYLANTLNCIFIVLAHWNNRPRVDMSLHLDTLPWFRATQSLFLHLIARCGEEGNINRIVDYNM